MRFGVDVGGTTVKIGVCEDYKVVDTFVVKTTKENLFKDVCEGVINYAKEKNGTIDFVGFGIPGVVIDNKIVNMPNIGLTNVDLNEIGKKYFPNAKIASTNDANAAALKAIGATVAAVFKANGTPYLVAVQAPFSAVFPTAFVAFQAFEPKFFNPDQNPASFFVIGCAFPVASA